MSAQTMEDAFAPVMARYTAIVMEHTWGHLAPKKNMTYKGVIRFAVGIFGSDDINPTVIHCELKSRKEELSSSPWFYNHLTSMLSDWASAGRYGTKPLAIPVEAGGVYEWVGTFRNYEYVGELRRLKLS